MGRTQSANTNNGHLRLVVILLGILLPVASALAVWSRVSFAGHDTRLRIVEQEAAAQRARYEAIQQSLSEIKSELVKMRNNRK